jgi:membrane associated rhomboid family serine protease
MIIYIPYGTDAPIYYRPIITIAMIVVNYIVYVVTASGPFGSISDAAEPYMLAIGSGLHPLQWLTTNFLHANFFHYLFNMLFLWTFGLIVEGKIGPYKMLAVYLGIGILYGAIVQTLMLGHAPTRCLGASAIIFGLATMSLVWAPKSEVFGLLIVWFIIFVRLKYFELKTSLMVCIMLALQIIVLWFFGGGLSSELLHLVGAAVGIVVGIVMLKTKLVDCEDWDIFSVLAGKNTLSDEERAAIEANKPENIKRRQEKRQKRQCLLSEEIEFALNNQTPLPAFVIAQRTEREFADWTLPQNLHLKMIQQLLVGKHWEEAVVSMHQYLERHQEQVSTVRLMLAQTLLTQNKPMSAIRILESISLEEASAALQSATPKILAKAEAMHQKNLNEGIYEMND